MKVQAALIREQGVEFAVVVVKPQVLDMPTQKETARQQFSWAFGGVPTVLMRQDSRGVPTYDGRRDLVNWLSNRWIGDLPWGEYSVT